MQNEKILNLSDICNYLCIGRTTAYKMVKSGELAAFKVGSVWKIPESGVLEYVNKQRGASA